MSATSRDSFNQFTFYLVSVLAILLPIAASWYLGTGQSNIPHFSQMMGEYNAGLTAAVFGFGGLIWSAIWGMLHVTTRWRKMVYVVILLPSVLFSIPRVWERVNNPYDARSTFRLLSDLELPASARVKYFTFILGGQDSSATYLLELSTSEADGFIGGLSLQPSEARMELPSEVRAAIDWEGATQWKNEFDWKSAEFHILRDKSGEHIYLEVWR